MGATTNNDPTWLALLAIAAQPINEVHRGPLTAIASRELGIR